jgi:hypothetical protein
VDFSTFIGAEDTESGTGIAVDGNGYIYVSGFTNSLGFFAINAISGFLRGARDGFVMKIAPDASFVVYSTYLGGFGLEAQPRLRSTPVEMHMSRDSQHRSSTSRSAQTRFKPRAPAFRTAFIVKLNADDVKTTTPFAFTTNGGTSVATAGQTAQTVFGYASIDLTAGPSPSGLAIIDLRSAGVLLNEVSVPVPPPSPIGQVAVTTSLASADCLDDG